MKINQREINYHDGIKFSGIGLSEQECEKEMILKIGDEVAVRGGEFEDMVGTIEGFVIENGRPAARVEMFCLGGVETVDVDLLEKIL